MNTVTDLVQAFASLNIINPAKWLGMGCSGHADGTGGCKCVFILAPRANSHAKALV